MNSQRAYLYFRSLACRSKTLPLDAISSHRCDAALIRKQRGLAPLMMARFCERGRLRYWMSALGQKQTFAVQKGMSAFRVMSAKCQ